jgi:hypothetical protein
MIPWFCRELAPTVLEGKEGWMMFLGYRVVSRSDGEAWFCIKTSLKVEMVI